LSENDKKLKQLIEIQYFGCIVGFISANKYKHVIFEQYETYQKMSFRNRCQVLGAGKVINLSVPLLGGRDQKSLITQIEIDYSQDWPTQHWRTLESCYNKSPFFMHYAPSLREVLFTRHATLWDLDMASFNWANGKLGNPVELAFSDEFQKEVPRAIVDCRNRFLPANRQQFRLEPYQQVFGQVFEINLSILDLLFNLGPQSKDYLQRQSVHL
jgi:hypothetical protein